MSSQYKITKMQPIYRNFRSTLYYGMINNNEVAVKYIPNGYSIINRDYTESDVMKMLQKSNNIVKYIDTIDNERDVYIVMEWIHGMNLKEYVCQLEGQLDEQQVRVIGKQIVESLQACNKIDMIYGDVKPENIMIDRFGKIKLIDFGCTRIIGTVHNTYLGTPIYFSPEMFEKICVPQYDVWGAGLIIYYLACGKHPFVSHKPANMLDLKAMICYTELNFNSPVWSKWSDEGKDLISKMLEKDPLKRIEINNIIDHKWFSN